jgi:hypothetical protein
LSRLRGLLAGIWKRLSSSHFFSSIFFGKYSNRFVLFYKASFNGYQSKPCGIEVRRFLSVAEISLNANIFGHQFLTRFGHALPIGCVKPGEHVSPESLQSTDREVPKFGSFRRMPVALGFDEVKTAGLAFLYA